MLRNGWIKIDRNILDWKYFTHPTTAHLWFYILLRANINDSEVKDGFIPAGSFIESLSQMSKNTGLTIKQVRRSVDNLKGIGAVTVEGIGKSRMITVNNWVQYQDRGHNIGHDLGHNIGQQNKNKEYKNKEILNNNKKNYAAPNLDEVKEYAESIGKGSDVKDFFDYNEMRGWLVQDWKAALRLWKTKKKKELRDEPTKGAKQG